MRLTRDELASHIDHTVLGPETTPRDVERLCETAHEYGMNVCVPPCYLSESNHEAWDLTVATVVGFPHGQHAPAAKVAEAEQAWEDGADELDVVVNVGRLKAGEDDAVRAELAELVATVPLPVKVIIETALLTDEEKHRACEAARDADADMVKTSTGFADGGATLADVELMSEYLPVKASGGVGSYEDAMAMLEAGAERIGASSGVEILEGAPE
jgi:deoxyribose-phosphate aldolase